MSEFEYLKLNQIELRHILSVGRQYEGAAPFDNLTDAPRSKYT